jgi:hypothetical protein
MGERPYDVFISYSHEDRTWVSELLLPRLERAELKVLVDYRDFEIGAPSLVNVERAVDVSRHTLVVLTPAWIASQWAEFESLLTGKVDPAGRRRKLIPVMLKPCELPPRIAMLTCADLTDPDTQGGQMARLLRGLATKARIFVCYKRSAVPYLYDTLTEQDHQVFIDQTMRAGTLWLEEIDREIKASDFLVVLLSKESADSEMVQAEVRRAYEYRKLQGHPHSLPVRVAYEGLLPYTIDAFLDPVQYAVWRDEGDDERVALDILAAIQGHLAQRAPVQMTPLDEIIALTEDGGPVADDQASHPPLPEFDPRFIQALEVPEGTVKLRDKFYVRRDADDRLERHVLQPGTITTIRAARQTGKSSLLVRGVHHARQHGAKVVAIDLQRVDRDDLETSDLFLRYLADSLLTGLGLDERSVDQLWRDSLGPQENLSRLMERHILPERETSIILAIDEADRLLSTSFHSDFFALLRAWHNSAAYGGVWSKLCIVMVISTEPYLLIKDANQSPFNVGLKLYLKDFDEGQVRDLNQRHGSPVQEQELPQFMRLLGGHPYLTRKALYTMVNDRLSWAALARIAPEDQGPFGDHLRHHHWLLRDEPGLRTILKTIIQEKRCQDEQAFFRLLRAGLVKGSGDVCTCRCDLYRIYFRDKL